MVEYPSSITVQQFYRYGMKRWNLKIAGGMEGMNNVISSARVQKTGLSLTGFLECATRERIQILGNTEMTYLKQLKPDERIDVLEKLLSCNLCCFIITKDNKVPKYLVEMVEKFKTPLFTTTLDSIEIIDLSTHYLDYVLAPRTSIHGSLLDIFGLGVLIIGESGVGKSECALDLINSGHRLVADDIVQIRLVENEVLLGTCPEEIRYLMEVRGIGLIDVKDLFGVGSVRESKKIELVVNLIPWQDGADYTRLGLNDETRNYLGIDINCINMPVAPGRNLSMLVEVAARNQLLKYKGINVAKRVSQKLDRALKKKEKKPSIRNIDVEGAGLFE
jgi:HPr kinase/phosphorylase